MPHLPLMAWDFKDQLQATQKRVANNGPVETTYYVYGAAGQRVRKVTETASGTMSCQRIYIGAFEVYREYGPSAATPTFERQTLQLMDDRKRIALVETTTADSSTPAAPYPNPTIRYQFDNHLGSACLELDPQAAIISYEEYYAYGSTSYQAGPNAAEVSLKRYRYTGKERDEESGFYYHGARYYAPWLGRWVSEMLRGCYSSLATAQNNDMGCLFRTRRHAPRRFRTEKVSDKFASRSRQHCKKEAEQQPANQRA